MLIVSVIGQRISGLEQAKFMGTWKESILTALRADYGQNLRVDGFLTKQLGGRDVAQLESHALTPNGTLNFLTKGWFDGDFPVACQSVGNGVTVTNDSEISNLIERIKLEQ